MAQKTSELTVKITVQSQKAQKQVKQTTEKFNDFRVATEGIRRDLGVLRNNLLLVSFAFGAVGRVMVDSIKKASDLQENINKFNVVFGEASNEAMGFADTLADTFQRSRPSIINMMASLQDTFVPLGFARDQASTLSKSITQLTFDLESFSNVPAAEVARALQSAIVGNHETVRRFGIILSEHTIQQEAFALGIEKSYRELTEQEKVLARVRAIIKGSADAQGDSLKTQEEFASQVRKLTADFEKLQIAFGEALLPFAQFIVEVSKPERVVAYTGAIAVLALGMTAVSTKARLAQQGIVGVAAAAQIARGALIKTGLGVIAVAAGEVAARMMMAGDETDEFNGELVDLEKSIKSVSDALTKTTVSQNKFMRSIILTQLAREIGNNEEFKTRLENLRKFHREGKALEANQSMLDQKIRDKENEEKLKQHTKFLENKEKEEERIEREILNARKTIYADSLKFQLELLKQETDRYIELGLKKDDVDQFRLQRQKELIEANNEEKLRQHKQFLEDKKREEERIELEIANARKAVYQDSLRFQLELLNQEAHKYIELGLQKDDVDQFRLQRQKELAQENLKNNNQIYNATLTAYDTFVNSLTDMDMSGAERRRRIAESLRNSLISFLGDLVKEKIKSIFIEKAISKASQAETVTTSVATGKAIAMSYATAASLASTASFGAASAAGLAGILNSLAATKTIALAAAKGADFVTSGPQLMVVGDNPGGRERVQVTPMSSPNISGPQNGNVVVNIHGGIVDQDYVTNTLIPAINASGQIVA